MLEIRMNFIIETFSINTSSASPCPSRVSTLNHEILKFNKINILSKNPWLKSTRYNQWQTNTWTWYHRVHWLISGETSSLTELILCGTAFPKNKRISNIRCIQIKCNPITSLSQEQSYWCTLELIDVCAMDQEALCERLKYQVSILQFPNCLV